MDREKQKTHSSLTDALGDTEVQELVKKGKEVFESNPPSETSTKAELKAASIELVNSTKQIVDALMAVIGAVSEQNELQKKNHESERLMMGILEGELQETRKDNNSTRHLIWASMCICILSMGAQAFLIWKNYEIFQYNKTSVGETALLLNQTYKAITATQENQKALQQVIEQKPTVTVRPNEKKGSADIEITQAVTDNQGNVEYDVVKIPLSLKGAQVRPGTEPEKGLAEKFNQVLAK